MSKLILVVLIAHKSGSTLIILSTYNVLIEVVKRLYEVWIALVELDCRQTRNLSRRLTPNCFLLILIESRQIESALYVVELTLVIVR